MPLNPETSPYYTYSTKALDASWPRHPGSVVLDTPSSNPKDYRLKIAYRKYETTKSAATKASRSPINLVFSHGNGMNKGLWHYHIDKIYQHFNSLPDAYINTVIAMDHANQGDSAVYNKEKLGHTYSWIDGARDIVTIVKDHETASFSQENAYNIVVGHSMGGFQALMAGYFEPNLFSAVLGINPVWYKEHSTHQKTKETMTKWLKKNRIASHFKFNGPNKNWKQDIINWYKTKSFYKFFDEQVLLNMLEDDFPEEFDVNKPYEEIKLKHEASQEFITYFGGYNSYMSSSPLYKYVKIPVYHVHSENDLGAPGGVELSRELLKDVVIPIDIPKLLHSMNAEQPDLTLDLIYKVVDEIISKPPQKSIKDFVWRKELGPDYKSKLVEQEYKEFILEPLTPPKEYKL
ncbi:Alpha/beta hydrolase family-domain-containing protein [Scheffersomyces coipomensis]|uniref:Alpha/beta hydrolase family-domain-containing protein n=1 Tax=Scheffersomyces coipomensis TaxID=1788519 RepID=UPI00315DF5BB